MSELEVLGIAGSGMEAQRVALDLEARNVAAAQVAGPEGFERLVPRIAAGAMPDAGDGFEPQPTLPEPFASPDDLAAGQVRLAGIDRVRSPDADAIGEMVAVLDAQRAFEADASIFDVGKHLAERAIDVGRV